MDVNPTPAIWRAAKPVRTRDGKRQTYTRTLVSVSVFLGATPSGRGGGRGLLAHSLGAGQIDWAKVRSS